MLEQNYKENRCLSDYEMKESRTKDDFLYYIFSLPKRGNNLLAWN